MGVGVEFPLFRGCRRASLLFFRRPFGYVTNWTMRFSHLLSHPPMLIRISYSVNKGISYENKTGLVHPSVMRAHSTAPQRFTLMK